MRDEIVDWCLSTFEAFAKIGLLFTILVIHDAYEDPLGALAKAMLMGLIFIWVIIPFMKSYVRNSKQRSNDE